MNRIKSKAAAKRILASLDASPGNRSTKDFEDLGLPFELFLRYSQSDKATIARFDRLARRQATEVLGLE